MNGLSSGEARIRRASLQSLGAIAILAAAGVAVFLGTRPWQPQEIVEEADISGPIPVPEAAVKPPPIKFTDVTESAGIHFVHQNGAYGERLLPETMGGGVAFLDYDGDGDQDLLLINSDRWPWRPAPPSRPISRLYRNLGGGKFEDVSSTAGFDLTLYGMGAAVGDYDGDGHLDAYVTALGRNRMMRNVGGSFIDVTDAAGVAGEADAWSTGAAFFDYDRDGDLDLFVCNYVRWSPEIDREVDYRLTGVGRAYGPPTDFAGVDNYLFRNDGDRFTDVSAESGIQVPNPATGLPGGKALAALPVDVNGDGWPDVAVANDTVRNFLFLNRGDGSFREAGVELGLAFDTAGLATGAMGIDAAHFANDSRLAIAIGNFANEMTSFYVSRAGADLFSDDAIVAGVGADSRRALTFGLLFLDADLDGRADLFAANGHVEPEIAKVQASQNYAQPAQLFWNCGAQCARPFQLVERRAGDSARRAGRRLRRHRRGRRPGPGADPGRRPGGVAPQRSAPGQPLATPEAAVCAAQRACHRRARHTRGIRDAAVSHCHAEPQLPVPRGACTHLRTRRNGSHRFGDRHLARRRNRDLDRPGS